MNKSLKYWMALGKVEGLGPVKLKKLLDNYGSAQAACEFLGVVAPEVDQEIEKLKEKAIKVLTIEDEIYPKNLKNIHDPPTLLFVKGEIKEADQKAIAIVGTRKATRYGLEVARKFAFQLSKLGITIISGLAIGIDTVAHEGALEAGGRTIAVLGSGIDQVYPSMNINLANKIEQNGALVSEFKVGQTPEIWTFPQRNRIIAGLSLGVIVVEGHYNSGAMITAKLALDQGREVFAVPGNVEMEQSKGPHWLIKQGAKLVESVEDVLEELKMVMPVKMSNDKCQMTNEGRDYSNLLAEEQKIVAVLSLDPKHLDIISAEAGLSTAQASSLLMMLELQKIVRQLPGKMFVLA